jgi:hypothetical protein
MPPRNSRPSLCRSLRRAVSRASRGCCDNVDDTDASDVVDADLLSPPPCRTPPCFSQGVDADLLSPVLAVAVAVDAVAVDVLDAREARDAVEEDLESAEGGRAGRGVSSGWGSLHVRRHVRGAHGVSLGRVRTVLRDHPARRRSLCVRRRPGRGAAAGPARARGRAT